MGDWRCSVAIPSFLSRPLMWLIIIILRILIKQYINIYEIFMSLHVFQRHRGDTGTWGSVTSLAVISLYAYCL